MLLLFFCAWVSLVIPTISQQQPRILQPIRETGRDVGLFIIPGAFLEYYQYQALGEEIQRQVPLRLWVYLGDLLINETYVEAARRELQSAGLPAGAPLYASGHSLGGSLAREELRTAEPGDVCGLILLAADLNPNDTNAFPWPAVAVIADLDGLLVIPRPARQFSELEEGMETTPSKKYKYPIRVINGINHGQFATGPMPERVLELDLDPEVSGERARELIADSARTFMLYYTQSEDGDVERSRGQMDTWFDSSKEYLQPMIDSEKLETTPDESTSPWVRETQYRIANVSAEERINVQVTVEAVDEEDLPGREPEITSVEDRVNIRDVVTLTYPLTTTNFATTMLEAKMKSYESVQRGLGRNMINESAPIQCRESNRVAWQTVYNTVPRIVKERLERRSVTASFLEDTLTSSAQDWLDAELLFEYTDNNVQVQSPTFVTSTNNVDLPGMHYCKLLSPFRVAEFLYVDSLRNA